ncbi:MAG: formylglycine-generating enzyme family protein [Leptolyngbyaceae cyanobacterium RU_5_1]|nr:formylglycine-generating enzyme family protein [Leptolyngbyaceae cyanobacterium RU_5_1]
MEAQQDITVLKRIGRELWQALSSTWGEKVTKTNFSAVLDRWLWQQTIQREQRQGQQWIENLGNGISLEMVAIPGGTFLMGSPENELDRDDSESPQHPVTIPSFLIGKYPVTQAQWRAVATLPQIKEELRSGPSYFNGDRQPVKRVSWHDAVEFCARLSAHTRRAYRLPSEAEWEYACRAGTTTPFHFGETIAPDLANYNGNYSYNEGPQGKYREKTTPVSQFGIANAFGLCDMHGNVWEWCLDHWHENYQGAPTDGSAWLTDNNNAGRVIRGGSWHYNPWFCRSAYRGRSNPDGRPYYLGFRVVCVLPRTP